MKPFTILKSQRIRKGDDFAEIYAQKNRAGDDHLLIFAASNDSGQTRFGLSVSKKHGNAVRRGRLKRLLREAFRLSQHDLPTGLDLILIPRQGRESKLEDYCRSLKQLARRLSTRLSSTSDK